MPARPQPSDPTAAPTMSPLVPTTPTGRPAAARSPLRPAVALLALLPVTAAAFAGLLLPAGSDGRSQARAASDGEPKAAPASNTPDPKAEAAYRDLFGAEHDRVSMSKKAFDKVAFARKLLDAAKTVRADRKLFEVIRRNADTFAAADKTGASVQVELLRMQMQDDPGNPALMAKLAELLEAQFKTEPAGTRAKVGAEHYAALRELAAELARREDSAGAIAALQKARIAARNLKAAEIKDALASVDEEIKSLEAKAVRDEKIARLRAILDKVPRDPKANLELGLLYLAEGDLKPAAGHFELCEGEEIRTLGRFLAAEKSSDVELGDAFRKAAEKTAGKEDRIRMLRMAVSHYETHLAANPTGTDSGRLKLLLPAMQKEIPAETAVTKPVGRTTNLLSVMNAEKDAVIGSFKLEKGALVTTDTSTAARIRYEPPEEYRLTMILQRSDEGTDGAGILLRTAGGRVCALLDAGPRSDSRTGFSRVDGVSLESNPKSVKGTLLGKRPTTLIVEVRRERITFDVDGRKIAEERVVRGRFAQHWQDPKFNFGQSGLGLVCWGGRYVITKLELTAISGEGKRLP